MYVGCWEILNVVITALFHSLAKTGSLAIVYPGLKSGDIIFGYFFEYLIEGVGRTCSNEYTLRVMRVANASGVFVFQ